MNSSLRLNRKGVSLMIGYVILIAIAIALSAAVFFYLKLYLPSEKPKCYENIDLIIEKAMCTPLSGGGAQIFVNFTNRGLFSLNAAYIKFGESSRTFRTILNDPPDGNFLASDCNSLDPKLKPGDYFCETFIYNVQVTPSTVYELSVEPLLWIDNTPVLCPESIVTKRIVCA